jgi:hypothetical protein
LFNYADTRTQQFFIEGSHPPPDLIADVYDEIASFNSEYVELSAREIASRLRIKNEMAVYSALVILEKAGHIERGRPSNTGLIATLLMPVNEALSAAQDNTTEGGVLRDLIFTRSVDEREQTEFDLNMVGAALGLSEAETRRAISTLAALNVIDYRQAYQGRGIRLLDTTPPPALKIDTKELQARLAAENHKLRRMLDYAYHQKCLRGYILNYFGERKHIANCGTCSNCSPRESIFSGSKKAGTLTLVKGTQQQLPKNEEKPHVPENGQKPIVKPKAIAKSLDDHEKLIDAAPTGKALREKLRAQAELNRPKAEPQVVAPHLGRSLSAAEVIVVKKILSCVARMRGRFGKGAVAAVLKGSKSKQVLENHLDKLSTYGILQELSQDEITDYIKALIEADCITIANQAYPTISLTEYGREVMLGQSEVLLNLP